MSCYQPAIHPLIAVFRSRADLAYHLEEGSVNLDARMTQVPMLRTAPRGTEALLQSLEFEFRSAMFAYDLLPKSHDVKPPLEALRRVF